MEPTLKPQTDAKNPTSAPAPEVKEIHHHHHHYYKGPNIGRIAVGVLLVLLGLSFLARAFGWVHFNFVFSWDILWPFLLIFFGLSIVSRGGWIVWVILLLVILVVIGVAWTGVVSNGTVSTTIPITVQKLQDAKSLYLTIETGAGKLLLSGGSVDAVTGSYQSRGQAIRVNATSEGTKQIVDVETQGTSIPFGSATTNTLTLHLASGFPTQLYLHTGASSSMLDLSTIQAEQVSIAAGASSLSLILGDTAENSIVTIDAGASSLSVTLPKTVGARLHIASGLTSTTLPEFTKKNEGTYESSNYETSSRKTDITLKTGVSSINFNWK